MAYETPITIKKALNNISKRQYVLPSIQREFVWDTDQIEKLFDSLMRDYPISTFLFWKVEKNKINDFQFYEILKHYHERDAKRNKKIDLGNDEDITAILDGQQRLTSLHLALTGSYAEKLPYKRKRSSNAYPKKSLYLNLSGKSKGIEMEYDFKFLTKEDSEKDLDTHWFKCSEIIEFNQLPDCMQYLMTNKLTDSSKYDETQRNFALNTLIKFFETIHSKGTLSYFLEDGEDLDKVLQIFIRINSGGTKLTYSDLLLSIATAKWEEKDAREVIHEFVDEINKIGKGFDFSQDLVLKSCLVLADFSDIRFKVDNFTKENMLIIENNWENSSSAVRKAIELVSKLGYSKDNFAASNAIIPIAYFIYKNKFDDAILHSSSRELDRKSIKEWLARVFLKGAFGGTPDAIYPVMRNLVNKYLGKFPLNETIEHYKGKTKTISFSEDDIENILDLEYGKAKTYCALSLLYSALNFSFEYHQDHLHPKSFFSRKKLISLGIEDSKIQQEFINRFNKLANLQLLQANQNIEKKDKHFKVWLQEIYTSQQDINSYLLQNHIGIETSLRFDDFINFYETRRTILKERLMSILNVKAGEELIELTEEE